MDEDFLRHCNAHVTIVDGEVVDLYVNPDGLFADELKEGELRRYLDEIARDQLLIPGQINRLRLVFPTEKQQVEIITRDEDDDGGGRPSIKF